MLFGHQNDDVTSPGITPVPTPPPADDSAVNQNPLAVDPFTGASLPTPSHGFPTSDDSTDGSILKQAPTTDAPAEPSIPAPTLVAPPVPSAPEPPAADTPNSAAAPLPTPPAEAETPDSSTAPEEPTPTAVDSADTSGLLGLKQQALSELEPLIGQLDQTPEEKFRTTMMLIQSTDNQSLLQSAYEIAQSIPDEKHRAQALLDVVNEINYFTQQKSAAA